MREKNRFGQYFTPRVIAQFMVELTDLDSTAVVLEPSCGEGVFIDVLQEKGFSDITAYEIDPNLSAHRENICRTSFVSANIESKFDLIIGNPPYIRRKNLEPELKEELENSLLWKKYCNSLTDYSAIFILKSVELLKNGGELIFICPEYWLTTTHSQGMRNYLAENGYIKEIYHFQEAKIFDDASLSIVIFRYKKAPGNKGEPIRVVKYYSRNRIDENILENMKRSLETNCNSKSEELSPLRTDADFEVFEIPPFKKDQRWILINPEVLGRLNKFTQFCSQIGKDATLADICDIGNGLVSGLDAAFVVSDEEFESFNELERRNVIKVCKAKNLKPYSHNSFCQYIYMNNPNISEIELKDLYPNFAKHFELFRIQLENRYSYGRQINYWDWVFKRNEKLFFSNQRRIFVPCKDRITSRSYLRFALAESFYYPTQDVTCLLRKSGIRESEEYILAFLNLKSVFEWFKYCGIVKGGVVEFSEKPLSMLPFRRIDWNSDYEIKIHDEITTIIADHLGNLSDLEEIRTKSEILFAKLGVTEI